MKAIPRLASALLLAFTSVQAAGEDKESRIPFSEIGARATADYTGDAIGITATADGAALRTGFQKLAATVTRAGLRLESTAEKGGGLHLIAASLGRTGAKVELATTGEVTVGKDSVVFTRPGLAEEYSVSVDGVRQDFIVSNRPDGTGKLMVELALDGARAEEAAEGATLVLADSGRTLSYNRLHVIDGTGRELPSKLEVLSPSRLAIRVEDSRAVYPVRIDPTFSDANWTSLNPGIPGANGPVNAAMIDGSGNLYIGGEFTFVGTVQANRIAKWDGSSWSALGSGFDNSVHALAVSGTDLYAGGWFTTAGGAAANRVAKWNGATWSALGTGIDGDVFALAVSGTFLYVGGRFSTAGEVSTTNIATWDGSAWSALGSGLGKSNPYDRGRVYALAASGTDLCAGGDFTTAGGVPAANIAKWNGSSWSALGSGTNSSVKSLAVSGTDLYAGGLFTAAGGVEAIRIAKWNGSTWSALGLGRKYWVQALALSGTDLYAAGNSPGGGRMNNVAKWNGTSWSDLGSGTGYSTLALAANGNDLYAVGEFTTAGGVSAWNIAKWDGSTWSALGSGMDSSVQALALSGTDLYAGGNFTTAGGVTANRIAKWNGSAWSALGAGMDGSVHALAVRGTDLYAGGTFTTAGGLRTGHVAKWNGSIWSALGSGLEDPSFRGRVLALAFSGEDLCAGGQFFIDVRSSSPDAIAKWNGSAWLPLGTGIDGVVHALAIHDKNLYAGGSFFIAGREPANHVAKWNGRAWSALGSGMGNRVNALAMSGSDLFAGGDFTTAGGVAVNHIAKWNGRKWSALGSGFDDSVFALAVNGTDLYVGGIFTTAGGVSAGNVAKWNGRSWSALGSGMDGFVNVLTSDESGRIYIGGNFYFAGTTESPFIALAIPPDTQDIAVEQPARVALASGGTRTFSLTSRGISATRTFTILNPGKVSLVGLALSLDGADADDFSVTASPAATVDAGKKTTFKIRFKPSTSGEKSAVLSIANNIPGKNPYVILLKGERALTNRR